jgi:hypothetical protein
MPTICPNCLRRVRTDANYCGFCGTNLVPASLNRSSIAPLSSMDNAGSNKNFTPQSRTKTKGGKTGRTGVMIPIILLCLVIFLALIVRFWPDISAYIGQVFSSLLLG